MATNKAASGAFDAEILQSLDAKAEYTEYYENASWLRQNWIQIQEKYPGQIIIIVDRDLDKISAFDEASEARKFIRELEVPNQAYVRYIPADNEALLL